MAKIAIVSLGCPKNQCDAELMQAKIADAGYGLVAEQGDADVVIINTCCFIQSAKEESIEEILEAAAREKHKIIVTGCLSERYKQQVADEFPEVNAVLSLSANDDIVEIIKELLAADGDSNAEAPQILRFGDICGHNMEGTRLLATSQHSVRTAYLRVADGCDNNCAYCAIPMFRGHFRSRPLANIVKEAEELVAAGVRELILVAQDVTNYGADLSSEVNLPALLRELARIDELRWVRLLYCYPHRITDELIDVMATEPKVAKYLDMPIQHCNSEILEAMNRPVINIAGLVTKLRERVPGIVLRSTVLVGFPGETPEQFTELAEFVHLTRFDHLGCFAYSQEEGTAAAEMPYQVDEDEKQRRREIIEEQQEFRVSEQLSALIGTVLEVLVEGYDKYSEMYFGRSYMQCPEIDPMVYIAKPDKGSKCEIGAFVRVNITEIIDNNLLGAQL